MSSDIHFLTNMNKKLKRQLDRIYSLFTTFGFDPIVFINAFRGLPFFFRDYFIISRQKKSNPSFPIKLNYPRLDDRFHKSGTMKGHYFHQDLYVARRVFENKPIRHLDIGSRVDGFVAHIAVFREIEVMDIRDLKPTVNNIRFTQGDLMQLPQTLINSFDSISSLHAIEHFGLGRYGDPVAYNGYLDGIDNIAKILKSKGKFYFSVPIGPQCIEFNAHRIFSLKYLIEILVQNFKIDYFSFVDDNGDLNEKVELTQSRIENNCGCEFGCGIFELTKK